MLAPEKNIDGDGGYGATPALRSLKQEDHEFKAIFSYLKTSTQEY
jgi:hypothetical protein